ncbi:MAG TPA: methionyl-tRNA formyltransferase [Spirochaetia bacterium]|nr:methionyl-tRNA formyltransferase [Spirochaetia bacterium]
MRIIFAGSPEIALPSLELLSTNHTVCAVLTNPDRPTGRGRGVQETAVSLAAKRLNLPLIKPARLGKQAREDIAAYEPEVLVVAAFGRFFGPKFLSIFPQGAVNLHPSLLPRYRGPSPIPAAILGGDAETGVTIQRLSLEMDSGDLLAQERIPLDGRETTASLTERAAETGARLLSEVLANLSSVVPTPQSHEGVSYCKLIAKDDGIIDWRRSAIEIDRMVRAYNPWPEAQTTFSGAGLHLLEATPFTGACAASEAPGKVVGVDTQAGILVQTGDGVLAVKRLKLQSKKELNWKDFLNGVHEFVGSVLGG